MESVLISQLPKKYYRATTKNLAIIRLRKWAVVGKSMTFIGTISINVSEESERDAVLYDFFSILFHSDSTRSRLAYILRARHLPASEW